MTVARPYSGEVYVTGDQKPVLRPTFSDSSSWGVNNDIDYEADARHRAKYKEMPDFRVLEGKFQP